MDPVDRLINTFKGDVDNLQSYAYGASRRAAASTGFHEVKESKGLTNPAYEDGELESAATEVGLGAGATAVDAVVQLRRGEYNLAVFEALGRDLKALDDALTARGRQGLQQRIHLSPLLQRAERLIREVAGHRLIDPGITSDLGARVNGLMLMNSAAISLTVDSLTASELGWTEMGPVARWLDSAEGVAASGDPTNSEKRRRLLAEINELRPIIEESGARRTASAGPGPGSRVEYGIEEGLGLNPDSVAAVPDAAAPVGPVVSMVDQLEVLEKEWHCKFYGSRLVFDATVLQSLTDDQFDTMLDACNRINQIVSLTIVRPSTLGNLEPFLMFEDLAGIVLETYSLTTIQRLQQLRDPLLGSLPQMLTKDVQVDCSDGATLHVPIAYLVCIEVVRQALIYAASDDKRAITLTLPSRQVADLIQLFRDPASVVDMSRQRLLQVLEALDKLDTRGIEQFYRIVEAELLDYIESDPVCLLRREKVPDLTLLQRSTFDCCVGLIRPRARSHETWLRVGEILTYDVQTAILARSQELTDRMQILRGVRDLHLKFDAGEDNARLFSIAIKLGLPITSISVDPRDLTISSIVQLLRHYPNLKGLLLDGSPPDEMRKGLEVFLPLAPELRELSLRGWEGDHVPAILRNCPKLRRLGLNPRCFLTTLSALPLEYLHLAPIEAMGWTVVSFDEKQIKSIAQMPHLRTLIVQNGYVPLEPLIAEDQWTALQHLDLSRHCVTTNVRTLYPRKLLSLQVHDLSVSYDGLRSMTSLERLSVEGVSYSGVFSLGSLAWMRQLHLGYTRDSTHGDFYFLFPPTMKLLEELSMRGVTGNVIAIPTFPRLRRLTLERCAVTHLGYHKWPPRLQSLSLTSCHKLTKLEGTQTMPDLRSLDISGASQNAIEIDFSSLRQLSFLRLYRAQLDPKSWESLRGASVQVLDMTDVTDRHLEIIGTMRSLRKLSLEGADITAGGILQLRGLTDLTVLEIEYRPGAMPVELSAALAKLQQTLPRLRISRP